MRGIGGLIAMIAFVITCFSGSVLSARGAFASREKLLSMRRVIGTKNPIIARIACFVGLVVCTATGVGIIVLYTLVFYKIAADVPTTVKSPVNERQTKSLEATILDEMLAASKRKS